MKDWKDIEKMSPEQLLKASEGIPVPAGLEDRTAALVDELGYRPVWQKTALRAVAAAAMIALVAGIAWKGSVTPKDTFDDPMLAYAEVEKALGRIAEKMQYGTEVVAESRDQMEKPLKMLK